MSITNWKESNPIKKNNGQNDHELTIKMCETEIKVILEKFACGLSVVETRVDGVSVDMRIQVIKK